MKTGENMKAKFILWMKRGSDHCMALFRIHEERILRDQASDKTLLYSLTLRIENGHEPVKQKARGENRVPQLMEHADIIAKPTWSFKQHWFSSAWLPPSYRHFKHIQP